MCQMVFQHLKPERIWKIRKLAVILHQKKSKISLILKNQLILTILLDCKVKCLKKKCQSTINPLTCLMNSKENLENIRFHQTMSSSFNHSWTLKTVQVRDNKIPLQQEILVEWWLKLENKVLKTLLKLKVVTVTKSLMPLQATPFMNNPSKQKKRQAKAQKS